MGVNFLILLGKYLRRGFPAHILRMGRNYFQQFEGWHKKIITYQHLKQIKLLFQIVKADYTPEQFL